MEGGGGGRGNQAELTMPPKMAEKQSMTTHSNAMELQPSDVREHTRKGGREGAGVARGEYKLKLRSMRQHFAKKEERKRIVI